MTTTIGAPAITRTDRPAIEGAVIAQLIDMALRRSGGAVEFATPGSLEDIGRIGLLLGRSR